ncbi:hypothetical protein SO802_023179 [Lithocarpus litseifolius]|uniref:peroxidase n=1 Tax=Lithocarpus litseifolius TaxID=425828 RepID=A0AAW2C6Y4_9ROSI
MAYLCKFVGVFITIAYGKLNYGNHQILLGFLCYYVYDGVNVIFARDLKNKCPQNTGNDDPTVPLDVLTPYGLDNKYYINLKNHHGLLTPDQSLLSRPSTVGIVRNNARQGEAWAYKFAAAIVKMGYVDVLIGSQELADGPPSFGSSAEASS